MVRAPGTWLPVGLRFPEPPGVDATEADFQRWVIGRAKEWGWRVNHVYRAKLHDGQWRTTCAVGWPDCTFVRDGRIVFAELKSKTGRVEPDQDRWLDDLAEIDAAEVHVWRPADWRVVVETLAPATT